MNPEEERNKARKGHPERSGVLEGYGLEEARSKIKIPKRRFLGPSPQVDKIVSDIINNEFENILKD